MSFFLYFRGIWIIIFLYYSFHVSMDKYSLNQSLGGLIRQICLIISNLTLYLDNWRTL